MPGWPALQSRLRPCVEEIVGIEGYGEREASRCEQDTKRYAHAGTPAVLSIILFLEEEQREPVPQRRRNDRAPLQISSPREPLLDRYGVQCHALAE